MTDIVTRGNTISFSFSFLDNSGTAASVASATLQLEYPGRDCRETELLTLTESNGTWGTTWDSSKARKGWVNYHAHAIDDTAQSLTEDGRFKTDGNAAGYQHDRLPGSNSNDYDFIDYTGGRYWS